MRLLAAITLLAALAGPAQAQMYKCVDERGVTSYSDKPRPDCKGGQVDIKGSPPISGTLTPQSKDTLDRQAAELFRQQVTRDRAEAQAKTAREARCRQLQQENARLAGGQRIARVTAAGERVYIEDADREKRLAELKEEMRGCP